MNKDQIAQVRKISIEIIQTVHEVGEAPAATIYAALMVHGASYEQIKSLMAGAVKGGLLTHCNLAHTYRATAKGLDFAGIKKTKSYPASALHPQADNKTSYAKSLGYTGEKPVYVLNGKVISHRSMDWFDFCAALRKKRHKVPDTFCVVVWHRDYVDGLNQSILLRERSYDKAIKKFNEYLKRPEHCRSFTSRNTVQIHGPEGLIHDLKH